MNEPIPFHEWKANQMKNDGKVRHPQHWYHQKYGQYCQQFRRTDKLAQADELIEWLQQQMLMQQRLHTEALPKFNWGESNLDANAIFVLNESGRGIGLIMKRLGEWKP